MFIESLVLIFSVVSISSNLQDAKGTQLSLNWKMPGSSQWTSANQLHLLSPRKEPWGILSLSIWAIFVYGKWKWGRGKRWFEHLTKHITEGIKKLDAKWNKRHRRVEVRPLALHITHYTHRQPVSTSTSSFMRTILVCNNQSLLWLYPLVKSL